MDRLIPDFMTAIMEDRPISIRSPHAVRPWLHVLEPLHGYLLLAEELWTRGAEFSQAWNFGPNALDTKPVLWIVENLIRLWGEDARWELDLARHPHEDRFLTLDCSKTQSLLGWVPKLRLATVLEWVVEWYRGYQLQEDIRSLTEAQIARYQEIEIALP
jgi:CDP-glucose 4,6-dehydratase